MNTNNMVKKFCIFSAGLVSLNLLNLFFWHSKYVSLIFGVSYFLFFSYIYGHILFKNKSQIFKFSLGAFFLFSLIAIFGSTSYYIYQLNNFTLALILVLIPSLLIYPLKRIGFDFDFKKVKTVSNYHHTNLISILISTYVLFVALIVSLLNKAQTSDAIRSPWNVLPPRFFIFYVIATLILSFLIIKNKKSKISMLLIAVHFILSFSIAWIIYKLGFGFDPFIHQASEKIIYDTGTLTPKPFYYIGQYSLVIFFSKFFNLSIQIVDKLLVPILAGIYLPTTIFSTFSRLLKNQKAIAITAFTFLAIPFTSFIMTTPQNLANLWTVIIILLATTGTHAFLIFFLALACLVIHPLAGIPVIIFAGLFSLYQRINNQVNEAMPRPYIQKILFWIICVLTIPLLPAVFFFHSSLSDLTQQSLGMNDSVQNIFSSFEIYYHPFHNIYNLIYSYGFNINFLILILAITGILALIKLNQFKKYAIFLIGFIILIGNYILVKLFVNFDFLINYEQHSYADRILNLSIYFLLPYALFAIYLFVKKILEKNWIFKSSLIVIIALSSTISLYLSYPHYDDFSKDRGYNTSKTDLKIVQWIEKDAAGEDYAVLANQAVSAAAIHELGFKKYYYHPLFKKNFFFYPIPTGDELYEEYLKMVYDGPSKMPIKSTQFLTGVEKIYFVVNNYWWDSEKIIEQAKKTTADWQSIDDKAWIFKY